MDWLNPWPGSSLVNIERSASYMHKHGTRVAIGSLLFAFLCWLFLQVFHVESCLDMFSFVMFCLLMPGKVSRGIELIGRGG